MVFNSTDTAVAIKSIHVLAFPSTSSTKLTTVRFFTDLPSIFPKNDVVLNLSKKQHGRSLLLPRCSTWPGLDTTKNPITDPDPSGSTAHTRLSPWPLPSKCNKGLVLDLGPDLDSSWDGVEIGSPVVKRYVGDDEERWYMWYHGRSSSSDSIGLATSSNGICWARGAGTAQSSGKGVVMGCRNDWWAFDTWSIRPSEIVVMSSPMYSAVYWMYYTGYTEEEVELNGRLLKRSLPGLACSQDGRSWARIEGDHHSGALLDFGSKNDWDSLFISSPKVVIHDNDDLRMYYHSAEPESGRFSMGLARSRDGIRWVKLGKIDITGLTSSFDEHGMVNANVVRRRLDGKYLMAYEGVSKGGRRSIGMAVSEDGLRRWSRVGDEEVLGAAERDGWDNAGVGSPSMVEMMGKWRLYYKGFGENGSTGIGMAVSNGSDVSQFRRWDRFHL